MSHPSLESVPPPVLKILTFEGENFEPLFSPLDGPIFMKV